MALDRVNPVDDPAQDGRSVAGARADLQHMIAGLHVGRFDHQRHDVRLRDRLAFADRQRPVLIGELFKAGFDEQLARDAAHGIQDAAIAHAPASDLHIDHAVASAREVLHGG